MYDYIVEFSEDSNIIIYKEDNDDMFVTLDPTDLSAIYGAYMQMRRELEND